MQPFCEVVRESMLEEADSDFPGYTGKREEKNENGGFGSSSLLCFWPHLHDRSKEQTIFFKLYWSFYHVVSAIFFYSFFFHPTQIKTINERIQIWATVHRNPNWNNEIPSVTMCADRYGYRCVFVWGRQACMLLKEADDTRYQTSPT